MVSHRTRRALLEPVAPRGHEVVELPQPLAEGDPVLVGELVELAHVLLEERARGHVRLDVGLDLLQADELRRRDGEVIAVVYQPRRRAVDLARVRVRVGFGLGFGFGVGVRVRVRVRREEGAAAALDAPPGE